MWRPMAEALGWPGKAIGWKAIIDLAADPEGWSRYGHPEWGKLKLGYTHPQYSSAGLLFLTSVIYGVTGQTKGLKADQIYEPPVEQALTAIADHTAKYGMVTTDLFNMMAERGPDYLHAVAAFEEGVVRLNLERAKDLRWPLVFVFPSEGTFWSDHPYCVLDGTEWVTPEQADAARQFLAFLLAADRQKMAAEYLLRPIDRNTVDRQPAHRRERDRSDGAAGDGAGVRNPGRRDLRGDHRPVPDHQAQGDRDARPRHFREHGGRADPGRDGGDRRLPPAPRSA